MYACTFAINYCLKVHFYVHPSTDINECARGIDGCQHNCSNSIGSFFCSCNTGYALTSNGKSCTGKYVLCMHIYIHS